MFSIGSFSATLGIDTGGYTRGILSAQGLTQAFGTTFSTFIANPVAGSLAMFANLGRAVVSAAEKILSLSETLVLLNAQTGISLENLQGVRQKLIDVGLGADTAGVSFQFFTKQLGEARSGSKAQADSFAALGLSLSSLGSNDSAFLKVLDALSAIEDPAVRAARAAEIFGRFGGAEMVTALGGGSAALREWNAELKKTGNIMSDEVVRSAAEVEHKVDALKRAFDGVITNTVSQAIKGFTGDTASGAQSITQLAESINAELGPAAERFGKAINDSLPQLREVAKLVADIAGILATVGGAIGDAHSLAVRVTSKYLLDERATVEEALKDRWVGDYTAAQRKFGEAERTRGRARR